MKSFIPLLAGAGLAQAYTVVVAEQFMKKNIDPIVVPGQYNSHMHSFFGSDAVNASTTTTAEMQSGCSTAENPNDYSSYWFPTLYKVNTDGTREEVPVYRFSAYYVDINAAEIAIPPNYKAVAGNAKATSAADVSEHSGQSWFCEFDDANPDDEPMAFPSKGCSIRLQTLLLFHDCVNPDTLESAYSGTHNWADDFKPENRCPADMFRMPRLRFSIRFEMRDVLAEGWEGEAPLELACGNSYCFHGDFINGWLEEAAENMLAASDKREFQGVSGPAGEYNAGSVCGAENAQDSDPENGTSDLEESRRIIEEGAQEDVSEEAAEAVVSTLTTSVVPTSTEALVEAVTNVSETVEETTVPTPPTEADDDTCPLKSRNARRAAHRARHSRH